MERGKITVAPFALGRAWELTLFKNWVKLANTNDKNFDRSDILITGGTANIHLVLRLPQNCVHSTIHNRSKKNPQNLQIEPTHNDSPLPCRFSSLTPSLNKSEVMSFSFQNKIPMIRKKAPCFCFSCFLLRNNRFHQLLLKVNHRILHFLARQQQQADSKCTVFLSQMWGQFDQFDGFLKILFQGLKEVQGRGNICNVSFQVFKRTMEILKKLC